MRIFLLPISTRRTLLYAHRLKSATASQQAKQSLLEKIQSKAAKTWAEWEQKESGWQKTVVGYGNEALKRIPYEEWALKSVPPLSTKRKDDELRGDDKVEVIYPRKLVSADKVTEVLHALGTEHAQPEGGETMLLSQANGKIMTQALDLPQLETELERAIWQVETAIEKQTAERSASKKDDPKSQ
ncbi:hypothetical protein UCDDA912_g03110 [Diaporthe ampelina]|uniref:Uncharacterized protein n=1 Tax=Diaporthe ampelina TaxID=1214573 RepID=A0A0G2HPR8_9PEZI|nr:hypothetical protein UCDDA912_g03110 [Diaporthe ampelina]